MIPPNAPAEQDEIARMNAAAQAILDAGGTLPRIRRPPPEQEPKLGGTWRTDDPWYRRRAILRGIAVAFFDENLRTLRVSIEKRLGRQLTEEERGDLRKGLLQATKPENDKSTVYVTDTGERYHHVSCRYLNRSAIPTIKRIAVLEGYAPCTRCKP